jgi:hypothetical protein
MVRDGFRQLRLDLPGHPDQRLAAIAPIVGTVWADGDRIQPRAPFGQPLLHVLVERANVIPCEDRARARSGCEAGGCFDRIAHSVT